MRAAKKLITVMLMVLLCVCLVAVSAYATEEVTSGTCGDNLTWTLDSDGTLTISGTGEMTNYSDTASLPWYSYQDSIKAVVIGSGVTSVGNYAFCDSKNLTAVTIPDGVTR